MKASDAHQVLKLCLFRETTDAINGLIYEVATLGERRNWEGKKETMRIDSIENRAGNVTYPYKNNSPVCVLYDFL